MSQARILKFLTLGVAKEFLAEERLLLPEWRNGTDGRWVFFVKKSEALLKACPQRRTVAYGSAKRDHEPRGEPCESKSRKRKA
jgi:hypothetical protein